MSNILEYTLSLNDKISEKLQKIAISSETALGVYAKLERQTQSVNRVMGDMGKSIGSLQQRLALLKQERDWIPASNLEGIRAYNREIRSLEKEINRLQTINGSKMKSWAKDAFAQMPGAGFITNPLVAATAGIGAISKLGIEAEKTRVSFEVLLGSQEKAAGMLDQMSQYAAKTPYQKLDIQEAAKTMLGFGIAQDKIMPNLKMLGDIAMGDSGKLQSLTLAFSQIQSTGKLTGQDLLQLINAGFNPLGELSKKTGLSMAQLKEQMEKGQISAQMVEEAFRAATSEGGLFHGMTEKIGQTVGGRLSTLLDNLKETALKLFEVIGPVLSPALDMLSVLLQAISVPIGYLVQGITWLINKLKEGNPIIVGITTALVAYTIATNASTIAAGVATVATKLWAIAQGALNAVMNANPIVLIVIAIAALVAAFIAAYQKVGWFRGIVYATWEVLKGFGNMIYEITIGRIKEFIKGIGTLGQALYKVFKGDFKGAWESAKEAFTDISGYEAVKKEIGKAKEIGKNAAEAYQKGYNEVELKKKEAGLKNQANLQDTIINSKNTQDALMASVNAAMNGGNGGTKQNFSSSIPGNNNKETTSQHGNITINIQKMVESIVLNGSIAENKDNIRQQVEEIMYRVLYAAQNVG
jgi:tape measure domain-containing protein